MLHPSLTFATAAFVLAACASTPNAPDRATPELDDTPVAEQVEPDETAGGWLETDTGLQHIESGVTCPDFAGDFSFSGQVDFRGQGESRDVACNYIAEAGGAIRLHITQFARAVSTDAYLKGSLESVKTRYRATAAAPLPVQVTETAEALRTDARSARRPDIPVDTAIWIEQLGVWHIKLRATYEIDRADAVADAVSSLFGSVRTDLSALTLY